MRATRLAVLTGAAALLAACASNGIRSDGGDVFVLESSNLSGSRAVENGLIEARDYCAANGRQFVAQDSRVGSGTYQLQFRCVAPYGTARAGGVDPLLAAAATPVATSVTSTPASQRRRRTRRANTSEAAYIAPVAEPAETPRPARRVRRTRSVADEPQAALQPLPEASALPSRFARPEPASQEPGLPPVSTTPLFNPHGSSFPAPVAAPVRRIPADSGPFAPIGQAAAPAAAQPVVTQPVAAALPAVAPRIATSDALPPIQLPPAAVAAPVVATPAVAARATSYGASVPSPQALPGASSALTPIASPLRATPAAAPTPNPNTPPPGFFSAPGR